MTSLPALYLSSPARGSKDHRSQCSKDLLLLSTKPSMHQLWLLPDVLSVCAPLREHRLPF